MSSQDLFRSDLVLRARDYSGRWVMRFKESRVLLNMFSLAIMATNTTTLALEGTFVSNYTTYVYPLFAVGYVFIAWFFDWSRLLKKQQQSTMERKANFIDPNIRLNNMIRSYQMGAGFEWMAEYLNGEEPEDLASERMERVTKQRINEWRNGISDDLFDEE